MTQQMTLCLLFTRSADNFQNQLFRKILSEIPSVSNSLDPDQARHFVGPDLGPNCFKGYQQQIVKNDNSDNTLVPFKVQVYQLHHAV